MAPICGSLSHARSRSTETSPVRFRQKVVLKKMRSSSGLLLGRLASFAGTSLTEDAPPAARFGGACPELVEGWATLPRLPSVPVHRNVH